MAKIPYSKPALTYQDQLQQLRRRGLEVDNEAKALHLLEHVSYYRLSGYWYPLLADKITHNFKQGSTFETAFKYYCFDRELRRLVVAEIEKIEVAIRSKMIYELSHAYGPFWFENTNLFSNQDSHNITLTKIHEEFSRSDEEFIKAFKEKYSNPLPPSWIILEITSFGSLSKLYKNLIPGGIKRNISDHFGLSDNVFSTWLHSIVYLRNVCAHHSRLWNRTIRITPKKPLNPRKQWLTVTLAKSDKTFFILSMIVYLLQTVNPTNTFVVRFKKLLSDYPNIDVRALGFPTDWVQEPLWQ